MPEIEVITQLVQAVEDRAWYPVVALSFTLIIALMRTVSPEKWAELPKWAKPIPAIVLSTLGAFVAAFQSGLPWPEAMSVGLYTLIGSTIVALGFADTVLAVMNYLKPQSDEPVGSTSRVGPSTVATVVTRDRLQ